MFLRVLCFANAFHALHLFCFDCQPLFLSNRNVSVRASDHNNSFTDESLSEMEISEKELNCSIMHAKGRKLLASREEMESVKVDCRHDSSIIDDSRRKGQSMR